MAPAGDADCEIGLDWNQLMICPGIFCSGAGRYLISTVSVRRTMLPDLVSHTLEMLKQFTPLHTASVNNLMACGRLLEW